jgi:hypothetical protein
VKCINCGYWEERISVEQTSLTQDNKNYWIHERDYNKKEVFYCKIQGLFINSDEIIATGTECEFSIHKLEYYMREIIRKDKEKVLYVCN